MRHERIVVTRLLAQRGVGLLGPTLEYAWPVEEGSCFGELVEAIDDADRKLERTTLLAELSR